LVASAAAAALAVAVLPNAGSAAGETQTYLVLYRQEAVPGDAASAISRAGGTVVASWPEIGVVTVRSASTTFAATLRRDGRVEGVAPTAPYAIAIGATDRADALDAQPGDLPNAPAGQDPLAPLQWDMRQIHAPEANAVTGGSSAVVVGDIDTGLDKDHPDLKPNIDFSNSVSCESGAPNTDPNAWDDRNGHGTHTAGTIAAAANGIGITGVAPNVRLAGIKSSNDAGYFFPEMVVCSFMWAGLRGLDVTNNSYFADPWRLNCRNDAVQRAIWKAEMRAIRFAMREGTVVVSSDGNENEDMDHPTTDDQSPDYPPGSEVERDVTNACVKVPVEVPGVIGVSAVGNNRDPENGGYLKSYYSSYGQSVTDVTAPGGDSVYGRNPQAVNGRVLSTYPAELPCSRRVVDPVQPAVAYCYLQGTSMASPHAAGVAALIVSVYGDLDSPDNGYLRPTQVEALLENTATPQDCPTGDPFRAGTIDESYCRGGFGHNGFYGNGQVDALAAITR
jgi:subtilisin family serine protease